MRKTPILFLLSLLILLGGCGKTQIPVEDQYKQAMESLDKNKYLHQTYDNILPITIDELKEKIANKETFIVYHGRSDCRFCRYVYPALSELAINGEPIYYVNLDYFILLKPEDENSELFKYNDKEYKDYLNYIGIQGSPNIMIIRNGACEFETSQLLNPMFFDAETPEETKEMYLLEMRNTISDILDLYNKPNNNTNNPNVTIIK